VDDVANFVSNPRLPFVGWSAFAHKGGIHVHAVASDPTTYEHVDPALVGNERHILVGELSGRSNVVERARELGFDLDPRRPAARTVAERIKSTSIVAFHRLASNGAVPALLLERNGSFADETSGLSRATTASTSSSASARRPGSP
jgi:2-isopropylmalate synthase